MAPPGFFAPDHFENLDEDPRVAFVSLVLTAQERLETRLSAVVSASVSADQERLNLKYQFVNFVMGAAKRPNIEPFALKQVPNSK